MTDTHQERILKQVVTALSNAHIAGAVVERSGTDPIARSEGPTFNIIGGDSIGSDPVANAIQDWDLPVEIKLAVRGAIADSVADPFIASAHHALFTDSTLASYVMDMRLESRKLELIDADNSSAIVTLVYAFKFRITDKTDLTS
jgi:hypothetical protein